ARSSDSGQRQSNELQRDLGMRAARIWERLSDDQRAETRYQVVLDLDGENQEALVALERIYRSRGDSTLLAEMLTKRAALESNRQRRKEILAEAARLYEGELADEFKAIEAWKKILEIDESDERALSSLAELYQRGRRFEDLVNILRAQAGHT